MTQEVKRAQVVKCRCGNIIAACIEPECYQDAQWMRDVRNYAKKGYAIDVLDCKSFKFNKCTCKPNQVTKTGELPLFN
jgi:hypothetical protein